MTHIIRYCKASSKYTNTHTYIHKLRIDKKLMNFKIPFPVQLAWLSVYTIIMQKNTFDVDEMDYRETAAILNQCICDETKNNCETIYK